MDEKLKARFRDAFAIVEVQPILKGWSSDRKYRASRADGTHVLLKLSDGGWFEAKRNEFELMQRIAALGVPMCQPIVFGRFGDAVYSVQSWIDGDEAEETIPRLSQTQQYVYGLQAGEILRIIHTIPAPPGQPEWSLRFNRKIDRKIEGYWACGLRIEGDAQMLAYIEANRPLLSGRPQCYQHGDYHIGNMMIDRQGRLQIIDFNRSDFGDPWEEFIRIVWCAQRSPLFASGMVEGYFGGEPPELFWRLLALYIANNTLGSIYWAIPFGQGEIDVMRGQAQDVLGWYDHMRRVVPAWYIPKWNPQAAGGIQHSARKDT